MKMFGTRGIESVYKSGKFFCPRCDTPQEYSWYKVRRWLVVVFTQVFPLRFAGEYVECQQCMRTYDPEVLRRGETGDAASQEFLAEFQKGIRDIMILIMLADGVMDTEEISSIQKLYAKIVDGEYIIEDLNRDIGRIQGNHPDIMQYPKKSMKKLAHRLSGYLNEHGKLDVFHAAVTVAWADGRIQEEEQIMLDTIIDEFEIPGSAVEAVLEDAKKFQNYSTILKSMGEPENAS